MTVLGRSPRKQGISGGATRLPKMDSQMDTGVEASTVTVEATDDERVTVEVDGDDVTVTVDAPDMGAETVTETETTRTVEAEAVLDVLGMMAARPFAALVALGMLVMFALVVPSALLVAIEFVMTLFGVMVTLVAAFRLLRR